MSDNLIKVILRHTYIVYVSLKDQSYKDESSKIKAYEKVKVYR